MRIGIIINTSEPLYHGGYENRAWANARELAKHHEVFLFTSCTKAQTIEGVHWVPLAKPRKYFNQRGVRNLYADVFFTLGLLRLLGWRKKLDLVDVCATPYLHLLAAKLVCWWKQIPLVVTCHEALLHSLDNYVGQRGVHHPVWKQGYRLVLSWIYRVGLACADHLLAVSSSTARGLKGEGYGQVPVVECGLALELYPAVLKSVCQGRPLQLIFTGRLTRHKRVDVALEALAQWKKEGALFHFHILGEGSEKPCLQAQAKERGLAQEVTFHGFVSQEVKRSLLVQADCFLMPSPREGFSVATMEAMASACAVIAASPLPPEEPSAVVDYIKNEVNGLLYEGEAPLLVEKLRWLFAQKERLPFFQKKAWETSRQYGLALMVSKLEVFYAQVAQVKKSHRSS